MIRRDPPPDFHPKFRVVGCFLEHGGRFLLLHRSPHKPQGGKWGVPAGKIDPGENEAEAMVRELREETGIGIAPGRLRYFKKLHVRAPEHDFEYHVFSAAMDSEPEIVLSEREHTDRVWVTPPEALRMPLVYDMEPCVRMFYGL